jgi:hypothetical protein
MPCHGISSAAEMLPEECPVYAARAVAALRKSIAHDHKK